MLEVLDCVTRALLILVLGAYLFSFYCILAWSWRGSLPLSFIFLLTLLVGIATFFILGAILILFKGC